VDVEAVARVRTRDMSVFRGSPFVREGGREGGRGREVRAERKRNENAVVPREREGHRSLTLAAIELAHHNGNMMMMMTLVYLICVWVCVCV